MAGLPNSTISGVLVALVSTDYDFEDERTKERRSGVSQKCYIAAADGSSISEIKIPTKAKALLANVPMGTPVMVVTESRARATGNNRAVIELLLLDAEVSRPVAKPVPQPVGANA